MESSCLLPELSDFSFTELCSILSRARFLSKSITYPSQNLPYLTIFTIFETVYRKAGTLK